MTKPAAIRRQLEHHLKDSYALERELGGGGMSRVFLATELALQRQVVIKVLAPEPNVSFSAERFKQEARLTAQLQHPNIVSVLAAGSAGNLLFYTMPFVRGESLRSRLVRDEALSVEDVESIVRDVLRALAHAHANGVVHRDIKPENILLTPHGAVVTDFGIAKATEAASGNTPRSESGEVKTASGITLGTVLYMAPEQMSADPTADHRVDLFALGLVAFECLTGKPAFASFSPQVRFAALMNQEPDDPRDERPETPRYLADLVTRCLRRDRRQRPASAEAALQLLDPEAVAEAGRRTSQRLMLAGAAGVALLVVLVWAASGPYRTELHTLQRIVSRPKATLHERRILVAPFAATPDNESMQALGSMIADFVAQGLSTLPNIEIVDSRTAMITAEVVDQIPKILRTGDNAVALAEETGAGVLITGRVYRIGDSVRADAVVIDAASRSVRQALGTSTVPASRATTLVDWVRRRAVAAVTQASDTNFVADFGMASTPPSLEAYALMRVGIKQVIFWDPESIQTLRAASGMDSTWILPRLFLALASANERRYAAAESVLVSTRPMMDRATAAERAMHTTMDAYFRLDRPAAFAAAQELVRLTPGSVEAQLLAVAYALYDDRLRTALSYLGGIDPDRGINLGTPFYWRNYGFTYLRLGDNRRALESAQSGQRATGAPAFLNLELQALASLRAPLREIISMFDRYNVFDSEPFRRKDALAGNIAMRLLRAGLPDSARAFARHAVETLPPSLERSRLAVFLGDSAAAGDLIRRLRADSAAARSLRPFEAGAHQYRLAGLAILTGDREHAVQLLSEAKARAHPFYLLEGFSAHLDPLFAPLFGDPGFEALVAPRER